MTKQFSTMLLSPLLFHSPQKPKGDCDTRSSFKRWQNTASSSNHPKSRKAIVTSLMALTASKIESSSTPPKSRKAIVTPSKTLTQQIIASSSTPPKSRKAIVTRFFAFFPQQCLMGFQSPQKPKGDCDRHRHLHRHSQI